MSDRSDELYMKILRANPTNDTRIFKSFSKLAKMLDTKQVETGDRMVFAKISPNFINTRRVAVRYRGDASTGGDFTMNYEFNFKSNKLHHADPGWGNGPDTSFTAD